MYQERFYRHHSPYKHSLEVSYHESDLYIISDKALDREFAKEVVKKHYIQIQNYIKKNPKFFSSLSPLKMDEEAPPIVKDMLGASQKSGIGPFSSVAGAIALYVGRQLLKSGSQIIVENGGDIFLKIAEDKKIGLYLGQDFKPQIITLKVKKRDYSFGICSSSSKIGPSLNFGNADLLTIIAKDAIVADTFATAYSNKIKKENDIKGVLEAAQKNLLLEAVIIAFSGKLFFWGDVELDG